MVGKEIPSKPKMITELSPNKRNRGDLIASRYNPTTKTQRGDQKTSIHIYF